MTNDQIAGKAAQLINLMVSGDTDGEWSLADCPGIKVLTKMIASAIEEAGAEKDELIASYMIEIKHLKAAQVQEQGITMDIERANELEKKMETRKESE